MDRFFSAWSTVADWALGQPVLIRLAVGSVTLIEAYLLSVAVLSVLMRLAGRR